MKIPMRVALGSASFALAFTSIPFALAAQTPASTLLVLNKEEASLVILDPASGRPVASVPTGEGPHEVVASTDGALAFVGNYGGAQTPGNSISVIDVKSGKELRRVDLGPLRRPHGLAFAGDRLFFTAETNRLVGRYDPASNQIDWLLGTGQAGTHMVVAAKDGSLLFTSNIGSDSVSIIEQGPNPGAWNVTVVPVGKGPEAIDLSPDGRELWTAHSRDGGISIIDPAAHKVVGTIELGTRRSNRLKFTPDGKLVLVTDLDAGELRVVDAVARREVKRIPLGRSPEGILIPPAGNVAYVAVTGDNQVAVLDLKTLAITTRFAPGKGPDGMAWVGKD
ncbi:MAG: YncE family protein [Acidobacteriota bacterium]